MGTKKAQLKTKPQQYWIELEQKEERTRSIEFDNTAELYKAYYLLDICLGRVVNSISNDGKGKLTLTTVQLSCFIYVYPRYHFTLLDVCPYHIVKGFVHMGASLCCWGLSLASRYIQRD